MIETEIPTASVRGVSWGLGVSLVAVAVRQIFISLLNVWAKLPSTVPAISQCQLKENVTHLNICLNQME